VRASMSETVGMSMRQLESQSLVRFRLSRLRELRAAPTLPVDDHRPGDRAWKMRSPFHFPLWLLHPWCPAAQPYWTLCLCPLRSMQLCCCTYAIFATLHMLCI